MAAVLKLNTPQLDPDIARTLGISADSGPTRRWIAWMLLLMLAIAAVAWGLYSIYGSPADLPQYRTQSVQRGPLTVIATATGTVKPVTQVEVGAQLSGRIESVSADFNTLVRRGQILARLDTAQLEAQVAEAEAVLELARAEVRGAQASALEARHSAQRLEQLAARQLVAQQELDAARAALSRSEASVAQAKAQVTVARSALIVRRIDLDHAVIRSPIDGIVISRNVEPGQTVAASFETPVLFKIAGDLSRMALHLDIDEADIGRVEVGQTGSFAVDAYPGRRFPARIVAIHNAPNAQGSIVTYEALLEVNNSALRLRPGMTAMARIETDVREDALLAPNAALRFTPPSADQPAQTGSGANRNEQRVWVLRQGKPVAVAVETGLTDERNTEVVSGALEPGLPLLVDLVETGA